MAIDSYSILSRSREDYQDLVELFTLLQTTTDLEERVAAARAIMEILDPPPGYVKRLH